MGDLGILSVAKGFKKLPKVQKLPKSGHTDNSKKLLLPYQCNFGKYPVVDLSSTTVYSSLGTKGPN